MDIVWNMARSFPVRLAESFFYPRKVSVEAGGDEICLEAETLLEHLVIRNQNYREKKMLEDLLEQVSDDQTFLDVGANYGVYSFLVSRTGANCIAVEPSSEFRERLLHNKNRLGIDLKVLDKAFYDRKASGVGMDKMQLNRQKKGKVDLVRCDNVIESRDLETPDIVKIDVEGAELNVLKGMKGIMPQVKNLYLEIHPSMLEKFNAEEGEIKSLLNEYSFNVEKIDDKHGQILLKASK